MHASMLQLPVAEGFVASTAELLVRVPQLHIAHSPPSSCGTQSTTELSEVSAAGPALSA